MSTTKKRPGKRAPAKPRNAWLPRVGEAVLIRTVTHYYTGRISYIDSEWIALDGAAWIADTGRLHHALTTGELSEVEPFGGPCVIARGCVVDVSPWGFALPEAVK